MTKGFTCPHCGVPDNVDVYQTYPKDNNKRRRYQCLSCFGRFTTVETMEPVRKTDVSRPREKRARQPIAPWDSWRRQ